MKIICPQCNFLKDVSEERFPSSSFMATCPKCKYRFRLTIDNNEVNKDENLSASNHNQINKNDDYVNNRQADQDDLLHSNVTTQDDYQNTDIKSNSKNIDNNSENRESNSENRDNNSENRDNNYEDEYVYKSDDLRKKAESIYKNESRRRLEEELGDDFAIDNPWDNPKDAGYISSFYQTVIRIMFFAPRFFAGLSSNVSLIKALIFYVFVVVLQMLISAFWANTLFQYIANDANSSDEIHTLLSYVSDSKLPMLILVKAAFSVMQLYVSSFIYYLAFSMVVKEKIDFSLVFQVIAYSIAPLLLSVVPLLGSLVGMVWAISCSFIGCRYALRLTIMQTALALAPIYLLILPLLYIIILAQT